MELHHIYKPNIGLATIIKSIKTLIMRHQHLISHDEIFTFTDAMFHSYTFNTNLLRILKFNVQLPEDE